MEPDSRPSPLTQRKNTTENGLSSDEPLPEDIPKDMPGNMLSEVLNGLSCDPPVLPSKYFYDDAGSQLFEQICELPEYYPTRTETQIMRESVSEMAECIGEDVCIVELGSGSSVKTPLLLSEFDTLLTYVPVDISGEHMRLSAETIAEQFPQFDVRPIVADFTRKFDLPDATRHHERLCIYFPGSTIGNFTRREAIELLSEMALMSRNFVPHSGELSAPAGLLIGIDLHKSKHTLEAAYDDSAGVTAAFNKNILSRINRELGADFDVDRFDHSAIYDEDQRRIEMRLVSRFDQKVTIGQCEFEFAAGSWIRTEYSHKYTPDGFAEMALEAGWTSKHVWTDNESKFAVVYLTAT